MKLLALCGLLFLGCSQSPGENAKPLSAYATQGWNLVSAYERAHKEQNVDHALALEHLRRRASEMLREVVQELVRAP